MTIRLPFSGRTAAALAIVLFGALALRTLSGGFAQAKEARAAVIEATIHMH
jgi:hypothetical protein